MKKKKGKLFFREKNGEYKAFLFRKVDKQEQELKQFSNAKDWKDSNGVECEYFKVGKQIKIYLDGKEIFDSVKGASAPVLSRKKDKKHPSIQNKLREKDEKFQENKYTSSNPKRELSDSFTLERNKVKIPQDVQKIGFNKNFAENFALKLNKFARFDFKDNKAEDEEFTFFNSTDRKGKDKKVIVPSFKIRANYGSFDFKQHIKKQKKLAKDICKQNSRSWNQKTDGRMVIGLGGASVYETSMTLHHIYGIPYIPASSVKGIVRSWIIQQVIYPNLSKEENFEQLELKKKNEKLEKVAIQNKLFVALFGSDDKSYDNKAHQGNIIFFDAFPIAAPTIEVDIMTPHYGDWYNDKTDNRRNKIGPTDTQSPTPIPFLTIAKDTEFQFVLGEKNSHFDTKWEDGNCIIETYNENNDNKLPNKSSLTEIAEAWLKEALSEHGIGAKTAIGYGYMTTEKQ